MPQARDLLRPLEERVGSDWMLWPDGGFAAGGPGDEARGVLCSWMALPAALERAAREGCNVVVVHEEVLFAEKAEAPPYRWLTPAPGEPGGERTPNARIRRLIAQHGLTVLRVHYGLDRAYFYDAFAQAAGLSPGTAAGEGWERVYELPAPLRLEDWAKWVKLRLGVWGAARVVGDLSREVRRVGNLWGGVGLSSNRYWARRLVENGADAALCGEFDESAAFYALESGLALVETSHAFSETIGMRAYAEDLRKRFPGLKVVMHEMGRPYRTV